MPGVLLTPASPWQPPQAAAAALPAWTGSGFAGAAFAADRHAGLRRLEAGVIGGDLDQRVVAQELDGAAHRIVATGARLVGPQLEVEVGGTLAGKMRHALARC